jgi:glycosyltransferase involved in cell wall biosynthesis
LKSVVNEQIVVDTGSTDRTVEIAERLGAKIFHFEWINDFSAARNFALENAKGDWIIFLDCDEYFSENSVPLLKKYMKAFSRDKNTDGIVCEMIHIDKDNNPMAVVKNISARIFKRKGTIRYENKIHEVLYNSAREKRRIHAVDKGNVLKIYHTGYDSEVVSDRKKNERNISMLIESIKENPTSSKLHYYLAKEYLILERYQEAVDSSFEALRYRKNDEKSYYTIIYNNILYGMYALNYPIDEVRSIFEEAVKHYPEFPDYHRLMGLCYLKNNDIDSAIAALERCIEICKSYSMSVESSSVAEINMVYKILIQAYVYADNISKIAELSTALLNADKYEYDVLVLLMQIFLRNESEADIIDFFKKLYDYNIFKDKMYLLKAAEHNKSIALTNYYAGIMSEAEKLVLKR